MPNANSPASERMVIAAERRRKAVALRIAGASYEQIGRELGITYQAAYKTVMVAMRNTAAKTSEEAEPLRVMELARLDAAQASIWSRVVQGDNQAIDRFLRISKRRGEITGIDAPTRQDLTSKGEAIMFRIVRDDDAGIQDTPAVSASPETS